MKTLVLQSHRQPLPFAWLESCLASVRQWAQAYGYDYRFISDELFDPLAPELRNKYRQQPVILSDLARLQWIRQLLDDGYDRVVWLDADFLVFDSGRFKLPADAYAVGREVWVQSIPNSARLKAWVKVHNAFLMFSRNNSFLDFYLETAQRLLHANQGGVPAQFIGPKLLTALHNICQLPVLETAGMLSPEVIADSLAGSGAARALFLKRSAQPPSAANLSASLAHSAGLDDGQMQCFINRVCKNQQL